MTGLEIASILIGTLCGNFCAVVFRPVNLGLFWNSLLGGGAGCGVAFGGRYLEQTFLTHWSHDFLAAAFAGFAIVLLLGGLVAFLYRK